MKKIAMVTGGSRGIGRLTAMRLADEGYMVAVNYSNDSNAAESVVEEIINAGGEALAIHADVTKQHDVRAMFEQASQVGELHILVNNAGILRQQMPLQDMTLERVKSVFETNVYGLILCCQQAIAIMPEHSNASIINVSSIAAKTGSPNEYVDYAASKGAVDTLTIGLAKELAPKGIRVNAVRPGMIKTTIHASGGEPDRVSRLAAKIPLQRGGDAQEVANAIVWLASEQASYCTGTLLDVAGGL